MRKHYLECSLSQGDVPVPKMVDLGTLIILGILFLPATSPADISDLRINEIMAKNTDTISDGHGEFDDWVEIVNGGDSSVDMAGLYLTDDLADPTKCQIPFNEPELTTIEPGGYLLVWFDKDPEQGALHVDTQLSGGGEVVGLFATDGSTEIDHLFFGSQSSDISLARVPDGSDLLLFQMEPTPLSSNGDSPFSSLIPEYHIACDPDSLAWIYEHYSEDHYIPVTFTFGDFTWTDTEMRIRGDSSRLYPKKSLKIRFNDMEFVDADDRLNFNAEYYDESYLHSVMSSIVMDAAGLVHAHAEHARLFLNGEFFGLYVRIENMDREFLRHNGMDDDGNLYKATLDGACLSIYDDIDYHWEKKTNESSGREDLQLLIDQLNVAGETEYEEFAMSSLTIDQMVNIIAVNMLISNGSTYYHNYFMYHDIHGDNQWLMIPWDLDRTWSIQGVNYSYNRSSQVWYHDNPYLERAISSEAIFPLIQARVDTLVEEFFNGETLIPILDSLATLIEPSVLADTTDQIEDIAQWQSRLGYERYYCNVRYENLHSQFVNWPATFGVSPSFVPIQVDDTLFWNPSIDPNDDLLSYALQVSTTAYFIDSLTTTYSMGSDTFWVISDNLNPGDYFWKVFADDGTTLVEGFDSLNPLTITTLTSNSDLTICEINYKGSPANDPGDWLELINSGTLPLQLSDFKLVVGATDTLHLPEILIPPDSLYVLAADSTSMSIIFPELEFSRLPTFFLSSTGLIEIVNTQFEVVDVVLYHNSGLWPSEPDGLGYTLELINENLDNFLPTSWQSSNSILGTPGETNSAGLVRYELLQPFPNPFSGQVQVPVFLQSSGTVRMEVYNILGERVDHGAEMECQSGHNSFTWSPDELASGIYFIRVLVDERKIVLKRVLYLR